MRAKKQMVNTLMLLTRMGISFLENEIIRIQCKLVRHIQCSLEAKIQKFVVQGCLTLEMEKFSMLIQIVVITNLMKNRLKKLKKYYLLCQSKCLVANLNGGKNEIP